MTEADRGGGRVNRWYAVGQTRSPRRFKATKEFAFFAIALCFAVMAYNNLMDNRQEYLEYWRPHLAQCLDENGWELGDVVEVESMDMDYFDDVANATNACLTKAINEMQRGQRWKVTQRN